MLCVDVATGATSLFSVCGGTSSSCSSLDSSLCVFPLCVCLAIFLFLGYVCCEEVAAARMVVSMGCLSIGLGGGGVGCFRGFLLLFLLCLPREVVDFLCCALFWAGAACDVCSCCCCRCVWQSLFSLVLMLLIMLIVLGVGIVSCRLACLPKRCGVAGSYSICN